MPNSTHALPCALVFCLGVAAAQQAPTFTADYDAIQPLLQRGLWAKAKTALDDLLVRHKGSLDAIASREALIEDMRRSHFGLKIVMPKAETLPSGKVLTWNQSTGRLKVQYGPDTMADFEGDAENGEAMRLHPAAFRGEYTITWRGTQSGDQRLAGFCELGSPDEFLFAFGGPAADGSYYPARIEQWRDDKRHVESPRTTNFMGSGHFVATLRVTKKSVELLDGEKKHPLLRLDRPSQSFGRFGFFPTPSVREIIVEGDVEPSWMQGLVDAHISKQAEAFDKTWKPREALPGWLFEKPAGERSRPRWSRRLPMADETKDAAVLERISTAMGEQKWPAAASALEQMPPDALHAVTADYLKAVVYSRLGRPEDALAACDRTLVGLPDYTHVRLLRASVLDDLRRGKEAVAQLQQALAQDPGEKDVHEQFMVSLLQQGQVQEAEGLVRRAKVDHGLWNEMQAADQMLSMRRRGPSWPRRFVHKTTNYEIASDIDLKTCQQAGQILEAALVNLKVQLAWTNDTKNQERFRVFLFSGEAGYRDYCQQILGSAPSHTAGLYTPVLKQLLIWNVPKREDMERTVRHEGFHQFLDRVVDNPPSWFNEGMAEYWETAQREKGQLRGGQIRRDHLAALVRAKQSLPSLEQFLRGTRSDFYANAHVRYPEAWAFIHFLRQGPRDYQQRYAVLWKELRSSVTIDRALATAFAGADWAQVDRDFWAHLASLR